MIKFILPCLLSLTLANNSNPRYIETVKGKSWAYDIVVFPEIALGQNDINNQQVVSFIEEVINDFKKDSSPLNPPFDMAILLGNVVNGTDWDGTMDYF